MTLVLDGLHLDTLRGYLGELLADPNTPVEDLTILQEVYDLIP